MARKPEVSEMHPLILGKDGTVIDSVTGDLVATFNLGRMSLPLAWRYAQALIKAVGDDPTP